MPASRGKETSLEGETEIERRRKIIKISHPAA
jgi:hypothetical protein